MLSAREHFSPAMTVKSSGRKHTMRVACLASYSILLSLSSPAASYMRPSRLHVRCERPVGARTQTTTKLSMIIKEHEREFRHQAPPLEHTGTKSLLANIVTFATTAVATTAAALSGTGAAAAAAMWAPVDAPTTPSDHVPAMSPTVVLADAGLDPSMKLGLTAVGAVGVAAAGFKTAVYWRMQYVVSWALLRCRCTKQCSMHRI